MMVNDKSTAAIRVQEAELDLMNGSSESTASKIAAVEDKVDELVLGELQSNFATALILTVLFSVYRK